MKKIEKGVSMIETMIAFALLSIVVLGAGALQGNVIKQSTSAMLQTQADLLSKEVLEKIRNNPGQIGVYTGSKPLAAPSCFTSTSGCTDPADIAKYDLYNWMNDVSARLPNGTATIQNPSQGLVVITLSWSDNPSGGAAAGKTTWTVSSFFGASLGVVNGTT